MTSSPNSAGRASSAFLVTGFLLSRIHCLVSSMDNCHCPFVLGLRLSRAAETLLPQLREEYRDLFQYIVVHNSAREHTDLLSPPTQVQVYCQLGCMQPNSTSGCSRREFGQSTESI
ncbi:hypothetical protein EDB84DRAFT_376518 [Lactarius hengduanensis]|nr:hypothetical protein EDB84DRAFT_376518 [Lactarius hengduanensis]